MTTIEVTQDLVDAGKPNSCGCCPIALAGGKLAASHIEVQVYLSCMWFVERRDRTLRQPIHLPDEALRFITRFDKGLAVQPFSFPLDIPARLLRPEAREGGAA